MSELRTRKKINRLKTRPDRVSLIMIGFFLFVTLALHFAPLTWIWTNNHIYSVIHGFGGGVAIMLGLVLLIARPFRENREYLSIPACAFLSISAPEIFGLISNDAQLSAWLDCQSTLVGAVVLFSLWLPKRIVTRVFARERMLFLILLSSFSLSLWILTVGSWTLPPAFRGNDFSFELKTLMVLGGAIYLACVPRAFDVLPDGENTLITTMALFFGLVGVTFPIVEMWAVNWWMIQILQFVPYLFAISYFLRLYLQNQRTLFESEARFRTLFEESPVGIGIIDTKNYVFAQANPALTSLLGYSESELKEIDIKTYTFPDDIEAEMERRVALLQGEVPHYSTEKRYITKSKSVVWVKIHAALLRIGKNILHEFRVIEDVTLEKEAESRINLLIQELNRTNAELERFTSVAAHDLKSPLNTITNYIQLIAIHTDKLNSPDLDEIMSALNQACRRQKDLIDDLLTFARLSKAAHKFDRVESAELCLEILRNLKADIDLCGAKIECENLPVVSGDRMQLSQLLQNLIGNAIKYRGELPPRIVIKAESHGNEWLYSVRDNGIGFSMEYAEKIFLEFQRLHGHGSYSGTGLGLPICRMIVKRHGGKIWAESQPGKGSNFFFTLPKDPI